jgi:hypothetical protein
MRIDSSGNVGIGGSPSYLLHAIGNTAGSVSIAVTNSSTGNAYARFLAIANGGNAQFGMTGTAYSDIAGASDAMLFNANGASNGVIFALDGVIGAKIDSSYNFTATGNVTAYSDARLKKNVSTIDNALSLVEKMRGVRYDRIDSGKAGIGVIAQEMQEVVPEVVHEGEEHLSVAYGNLVGVLIEAVKELSARVKELEAK